MTPPTSNPSAMSQELLPCPFCGGEAMLVEWQFNSHDSWVECKSCEIAGPAANSENKTWHDHSTHGHLRQLSNAEAIAAWNRRSDAALLSLQRKNEELVRALTLIENLRQGDAGFCREIARGALSISEEK